MSTWNDLSLVLRAANGNSIRDEVSLSMHRRFPQLVARSRDSYRECVGNIVECAARGNTKETKDHGRDTCFCGTAVTSDRHLHFAWCKLNKGNPKPGGARKENAARFCNLNARSLVFGEKEALNPYAFRLHLSYKRLQALLESHESLG